MAPSTIETFEEAKANLSDRVAAACRQTAHLSHEARLLKSLATDAVEDGVHTAKRAIKRGVVELEDLKDEAVHRVRRQPLRAVGIAVGVGLVVGAAVGWLSRRPRE